MKRGRKLGALVVAAVVVWGAGQVALAQVEWTIGGVAVPPGSESGHQIKNVIFDGTTYHMYLLGGPGGTPLDTPWWVGHWTWDAGTTSWVPDPCNPVLEPKPGEWDGFSIQSFSVVRDEATGVFKMWYGAAPGMGSFGNGGYATNDDGWCNWDEYAGNPLPGLGPGSPGSWDDNGCWPDEVLFDGGLYHMWWVGSTGDVWAGTWSIGHATSVDGLVWSRDPDPVLVASAPWEETKVYAPTVVKHHGRYHMWYAGLFVGQWVKVGYAVSDDGVSWTKFGGNPVLSPLGCLVLDSVAVLDEPGDDIHGWVEMCADIREATSSFNLLFFDTFETGDTGLWSAATP